MARGSLPNVEKLDDIQDAEMQAYATIGMTVALWSRLDAAIFDVLRKGRGLDHAEGKEQIKAKPFERLELAVAAMDTRLAEDARHSTWKAIADRLKKADKDLRNRSAHGLVRNYPLWRGQKFAPPGVKVHPNALDTVLYGEGFGIDRFSILEGPNRPHQSDVAKIALSTKTLAAACRELIVLLRDIEEFLDRLDPTPKQEGRLGA